MTTTIRRLLGLVITGLCAVSCASAQQIPPVSDGEPIVRTTMADNRVTMVDLENEHAIMLPGGLLFSGFAPAVSGNVSLQEQPNGFDLVYTFTNTGAAPASMGRLNIGKFNLGNNIHYRDFRHIGEPVLADYNNYSVQAFPYPGGIYSPVWTLYNDDYAVSVSLQYPVMSYRHQTRCALGSTPADASPIHGPRGWFVEYRLANLGNEPEYSRLRWPGELAGGESRTYVVSVRVTKNTNDWIRTLLPYRDYFRSMYGGVQYQRDARPVRAVLMAVTHLISDDNPYGFDDVNRRGMRPDLYGFRPWSDEIKSWSADWKRVMLWTPTGLFNENRNMNFPFQFTTRWLAEDRMSNVFDEEVGLPSVHRAGMELGLWWGRSVQVMREWNTAQWEALDPDNPAHVQAAFAEMDLAVRAGATCIGLDTFSAGYVPLWKLAPWLERMREAYPQVKFIIEPVQCDILHRLGGMYVVGWNLGTINRMEDIYDINNPYYLADLLVPGHESWGAFSYHRHRSHGYPVTPEMVQEDAERIASLGYVPLAYTLPEHPDRLRAAESWLTTLPADVLRGSGWNVNYNGPRAHRRPDGSLVIISDSGGAPSRPTPRNGRVGGHVPERPGNTPGPRGDAAPADASGQPEEPPPSAPISRSRRKYNIDLRLHRSATPQPPAAPVTEQIAVPAEEDLPGVDRSVAIPANAGAGPKSRHSAKGVSPAWLELLARKGYVDGAHIRRAVEQLPSTGPAKVVPGSK